MERQPSYRPPQPLELYQQIERFLLDAPITLDVFETMQKDYLLEAQELLISAEVFTHYGFDAPDRVEIGLYTELPTIEAGVLVKTGVESALVATTRDGVITIYSLWVSEVDEIEFTKIVEPVQAKAARFSDNVYDDLARTVESHDFERVCELDTVSDVETQALIELLGKLSVHRP